VPPWRHRGRGSTGTDFFSSASSFPTEIGSQISPGEVRGYYFDLRFKAEEPSWPPPLSEKEIQFHVDVVQWGLGCYERFLAGEGEPWLAAALATGEHLLKIQQSGGPLDGAWLHQVEMRHTYHLRPPWVSAMAQGESASLLVRLHRETGEERWADAARRGLQASRVPSGSGGATALLDGRPFPEEYPTDPPSFVLNGGIFALWGLHDVAAGLGDEDARRDFESGVETLSRNIERWDAGFWSLYDLFPHPLPNYASGAYHQLHIAQLRAMQLIAPRPELERAASRFEGYAASSPNSRRAFVRKAMFRLLVPRNRALAHRLPWSHARRRVRDE
jgi:heparosan-N-sulfate-glucuronate 5-epimerase